VLALDENHAPAQLLEQLVAPYLFPVLGVLLGTHRRCPPRQLADLLAQPLLFLAHPPVAHRLLLAGVGLHLRPIHQQRP
jgi:hypothetical protein